MNVWQRIDTEAQVVLKWAEHLLTATVEAEIAALAPLAVQAIGAVVLDIGALTTPGGIVAAIVSAAGPLLKTIEEKGLQVASGSILASLGAAATSLAMASSLSNAPAPAPKP